jgi:hypothetical protein
MVFLLVASALALHDASRRTDFRQEKTSIDEAAFNVVNNAFNNYYEEVVSLNKEGWAKEIQQRSMPFDYDFNRNSIFLSQRLPLRESSLEAYFDTLNIYSLFVNEMAPADLNIETKTFKNTEWNGALYEYPDLNYVILPQCLLYDVNSGGLDVNWMILQELHDGEKGCSGGFDYESIEWVDVNIAIDSRTCDETSSISGNLAGKNQEFDPGNSDPYLTLSIEEKRFACPGTEESNDCFVTGSPGGKYLVRTHFDPESFSPESLIDSLLLSCSGESWVRVKVGKETAEDEFPFVAYNRLKEKPVSIDLNITFDGKVELFYFTGFSINVEKKNFGIKRSTEGG